MLSIIETTDGDVKKGVDRPAVVLNSEQEAALQLMESGVNVFLTGKAGTGKSTVLREFRRRCTKPTLYVAPTGIAALNVGGQTIHSCFQIKPGMMSDLEPISSKKRYRVLRNAKVIVIDEISMVRADLLTAVDARLRQVVSGNDVDRPFGGKQLIVVGDFLQLPPVVENALLSEYLQMRYGGVYAFQSGLWSAADFKHANLSKVFRQTDGEFLDVLNNIRVGNPQVLDKLSDRANLEYTDKAVVLTPYRNRAEQINTAKLDELSGREVTFTAEIQGKFTKDYPVEPDIELKCGARVMLAVNRYDKDGEPIYVNGTLGVVVSISASGASVKVRTDDGVLLNVTPYEWEMFDFDYSGPSVVATKVGSFIQLPLRLAWAVTIHRSQGCTFDEVHLDLGRGCFAPGQLYTALSRVRTLQGLTMSRQLTVRDIHTASEVVEFYNKM